MRSRPVSSEQGMALPMVLMIIVCIMILAFSFLWMFTARARVNAAQIKNYTSDYIAEVGLSKYLWQLNQDDKFYQDPNNLCLAGYFKEGEGYYYVTAQPPDLSATPPRRFLTLTCTGWLAKDPDNKYSFTAQVAKRQFCQYIYCSNMETTVPQSEDSPGETVKWITGDKLHGKLFTNNIIHTEGSPEFFDSVQFAAQNKNPPLVCDLQGTPIFHGPPPQPQKVNPMQFPPNNDDLRRWGSAAFGGYYFNGRTCIYLKGTTMDVVSYDPDQGKYITNTSLPLPSSGVIYVDGAQRSTYNDNNSNGERALKFNPRLGNVFVSGRLEGRLTIAATNNIYITGADPTSGPPSDPHGDGGVTYATTTFGPDGSVSNLGSNDMLGLVTNNYVMILRYGWPAQNAQGYDDTTINNDYSPQNVYVNAAIMAVCYSWQYEGWWDITNPRDYIHLHGSVIQGYRGPVGKFSGSTRLCGYLKDYWHDPRMDYETPPHFLNPLTSGWGILTWTRNSNLPAIPWVSPTSVDVTAEGGATSIYAGSTLRMQATVLPEDVTIKNVDWTVENHGGANATIDPSTGLLTAGAHAGTVIVTATSQDPTRLSGSRSITINLIPASSVTVTAPGNATSMFAGGTLQMSATVLPENASLKTVSWSVVNSGGANATIDYNTGLLTAGAHAGTVTVTARSADGYATSMPYTISISVPVTGITVTGQGGATSVTRGSENTLQMIATVTPYNATNPAVDWSVVNSGGANATITPTEQEGVALLTAGTVGGMVTVTATARDGSGVFGSANIVISVPVTGITVSGDGGATSVRRSTSHTTRTLQINATVIPSDATNKTVTWSIADPNGTGSTITSISATSARLTAGANTGTVYITATSTDGTNVSNTPPLAISITTW